MTLWLLACSCLLAAFTIPAAAACRGSPISRCVAVQLASSLMVLLLCVLTFVLDQPSFMDLPLGLSLLSFIGTLLYAHFFERWL
jgi:multisubunit Na+/H+ antiporter MnhF subunit